MLKKNRYYIIAVGSNITPHQAIAQAKKMIQKQYKIIAETEFQATKPIGMSKNCPDFINGCWLLMSPEKQKKLNKNLKKIEIKLGRPKNSKWENRIIDLDIVAIDNTIIDEDYEKRHYLKIQIDQLLSKARSK